MQPSLGLTCSETTLLVFPRGGSIYFSDIETVVVTKVIPRLCQFATDSDIESDAEFTDSESEHGPGQNRGGKNSVHQASGWRNWCSLM